MNRRRFIQSAAVGLGAALAPQWLKSEQEKAAEVSAAHLPRWRGFNLLEKFSHTPEEWKTVAPEWGRNNEPFRESDFEWMAQWGFDFARLPMSYKCWVDPSDPLKFLDKPLQEIDRAVDYGRQYGIHVNLAFHRAPGYCINPCSGEPTTLWTDPKAQEMFLHHWRHFAKRYKGIAPKRLSFDLVNEPTCTEQQYVPLVKRAVDAIHAEDPARLVIADGLSVGTVPTYALAGTPVAQSARGYHPSALTHYLAPWAGNSQRLPTWPLLSGDGAVECDRGVLRQNMIEPWKRLEKMGVGVHVGEWGCYNKTPHPVTLAWMRDNLALWKEAGWGWSLWCFRGSFGILDSGRSDVAYESYKGCKLDREMLELLREY